MSGRTALIVSALAAAALGAVGVVVAVVSGSGAILLDGLFNVCFFATALLTLRVAALLERPDDEHYPFGYLFFEPLLNTAKGLLILGVSLSPSSMPPSPSPAAAARSCSARRWPTRPSPPSPASPSRSSSAAAAT